MTKTKEFPSGSLEMFAEVVTRSVGEPKVEPGNGKRKQPVHQCPDSQTDTTMHLSPLIIGSGWPSQLRFPVVLTQPADAVAQFGGALVVLGSDGGI